MILTDDVVSRVARSILVAIRTSNVERDALAWELTDEELAQIARAALEAARYGEIVECIARVRRLWIASAFPVNVAEAGEIYDAIDREIALLSTIGESNLKGDRG